MGPTKNLLLFATPKQKCLHLFLISIVAILLSRDYYNQNPLKARLKDPEFTVLGPYTSYEVKNNDVYNQLIDIKNFSFLMNPQPCKGYSQGLFLTILVASSPKNQDNRRIIRSTWGKSTDSIKVVFLLGSSENATINRLVSQESKIFNDIVQGSFRDDYRNMTYKHTMGLKWVVHHCPTAKYVLKMDDDVVVNMKQMKKFLARELSPWGVEGLLACRVFHHAPPYRDNSKWKVTLEEYGLSYYPPYCAGWGIIYSIDVVAKLLEGTQAAPYFWIDDAHITGLIAQRIGVTRTDISSLILYPYQAEIYVRYGPKSLFEPFVFGPYDVKPAKMMDIWKALGKY